MRDPRHDLLFEQVKVGPLTAKNRFYQVPHCNGGGYRDPSAVAEMRRVKAEGGWGVIFTEQVEIHHTSEITPFIELRLWEDKDIPSFVKMSDAIHSHGALAGIELAYPGVNGPNLYSREVPMAPTALPIQTFTSDPVQARAMDKADIRNLRQWHRKAYLRSKQAGFDILCLYGAHGFGVIQHFLSPRINQRTDEYGGSLKNRARLFAELVADARDAVGDTCAIAVRLSLDELAGVDGFTNQELRELVAMHFDLPDLWDFAHGTWEACSGTSRFKEEAAQENLIRGLKQLTPKPVVGVGRFTSVDQMVRQVKQGLMDFVGAARPSIADPFLPQKIETGRVEDIRECIGCNICVTGDMTMGLSRCTQNSSFMEEWRKGWHPERMRKPAPPKKVLVVGAGPAGLSAAHRLGLRGYEVALAEASKELGGRVTLESRLPGLSAWARVRDYRLGQLTNMAHVEIYRESALTADDVLGFGAQHVCIATGSRWRRDGVARFHLKPIPLEGMDIHTPDDLMAGVKLSGHVMVYDDDHYYMGGVLCELLVKHGCTVTLVTPSTKASEWSFNTLEQGFIQKRLLEIGVDIRVTRALIRAEAGAATLACTYTGREETLACASIVLVTARLPRDEILHDLMARQQDWQGSGVETVKVIGDAQAPSSAIAWSTYAGHRYAEELDEKLDDDVLPFRREIAELLI